MTIKQFKIWMAANDYNQVTLAADLGISAQTITNYIRAGRFPVLFQYALKGLENKK